MIKLRFTLTKKPGRVLFQIKEQTEKFLSRSWDDPSPSFDASNGMTVSSLSSPELTSDTIFLRGASVREDSNIAEIVFPNDSERDEYYARVLSALRDWAKSAPQFKRRPRGSCFPAKSPKDIVLK